MSVTMSHLEGFGTDVCAGSLQSRKPRRHRQLKLCRSPNPSHGLRQRPRSKLADIFQHPLPFHPKRQADHHLRRSLSQRQSRSLRPSQRLNPRDGWTSRSSDGLGIALACTSLLKGCLGSVDHCRTLQGLVLTPCLCRHLLHHLQQKPQHRQHPKHL